MLRNNITTLNQPMVGTLEPARAVSAPDVSRRTFSRWLLYGIAGLALDQTLANVKSAGTLLAHVAALTDVPAPSDMTRSDYTGIYAEYGTALRINERRWIEGGDAEGLDMGFSSYFGKSLNEMMPTVVEVMEQTKVMPELAVSVLAYWGRNKIGSTSRVLLEKITNIAQTEIASNLDIADDGLNMLGVDGQPVREFVTQNEMLRRLGDSKLSYRAQKSSIATRTVGFFDKEPVYYAAAISKVMQKHPDVGRYIPEVLVTSSLELLNVERMIRDYRKANQTITTPYDDTYLEIAHGIEQRIVQKADDPHFNLLLTCLCIKHQEILIRENFTNIWNWSSLNSDQIAMLTYWCLTGSDNSNVITRPDDFNPRIDSFADQRLIVPAIVQKTLKILPGLGYPSFGTIKGLDAEKLLSHPELPSPYKKRAIKIAALGKTK